MEHAIGTRITLEVVETENATSCDGCFFRGIAGNCMVRCIGRTDGKNIIYKEVKEEKQ